MGFDIEYVRQVVPHRITTLSGLLGRGANSRGGSSRSLIRCQKFTSKTLTSSPGLHALICDDDFCPMDSPPPPTSPASSRQAPPTPSAEHGYRAPPHRRPVRLAWRALRTLREHWSLPNLQTSQSPSRPHRSRLNFRPRTRRRCRLALRAGNAGCAARAARRHADLLTTACSPSSWAACTPSPCSSRPRAPATFRFH